MSGSPTPASELPNPPEVPTGIAPPGGLNVAMEPEGSNAPMDPEAATALSNTGEPPSDSRPAAAGAGAEEPLIDDPSPLKTSPMSNPPEGAPLATNTALPAAGAGAEEVLPAIVALVKADHVEGVRKAIADGADPKFKDAHSNTLLHFVRSPEVALILISAATQDISAINDEKDTILHCAAKREDAKTLAYLSSGFYVPVTRANIFAKNKAGLTAKEMTTNPSIKLILEGRENEIVRSTMDYSYRSCDPEVVTSEIERNAISLQAADDYGRTLVFYQALDRAWMNSVFLPYGANLNSEDKHGNSVLAFQALNLPCSSEALKGLMALGATLDAHNKSGNKLLELLSKKSSAALATKSNYDRAAALIICGADVTAQDEDANTSLHLIATRTREEDISSSIAPLLIAKGAKINAVNHRGYTPLQLALTHSCLVTANTLIEHGANILSIDENDNTLLHLVSTPTEKYNPSYTITPQQIATALIAKGLTLTAKNKQGNQPLHSALLNGSFEVAKLLIESGAPLDAQGEHGNTPFHLLAQSKKLNRHEITVLANLLREKGASLTIKNTAGETPYSEFLAELRLIAARVSAGAGAHAPVAARTSAGAGTRESSSGYSTARTLTMPAPAASSPPGKITIPCTIQ